MTFRTLSRALLICAALLAPGMAGVAYADCSTAGNVITCIGNIGNKGNGLEAGDNFTINVGDGYVAGSDSGMVIGSGNTININASAGQHAAVGGLNGNAISWGSNNTLNLGDGSALIGDKTTPPPPGTVTGGSNNTINLGGTGLAPNGLDVGSIAGGGFANFNVNAAANQLWVLSGTGNAGQNWHVNTGVLAGDTNSIQGSAIVNNATLAFSQTFGGTYGGVISGGGLVAVDCENKTPCGTFGTVTFTGANTYTGVTGIKNGTLALSGGGSIANSNSVQIAGGATLDISGTTGGATIKDLVGATGSFLNLGTKTLTFGTNSGLAAFAGNITGTTGGLVKNGTGTVVLTGTNSYTGGTTVNAGVLGGNTGSLQGDIALGSGTILAFQQTADGTYNNVISGAGELANLADGFKLTLTAVNTYTGDTAVKAGTLALSGAGSIANSSSLQLGAGATFDISAAAGARTITDLFGAAGSAINLGGNQLTFGTATAQTAFAGNISGVNGSLDKVGSGTVILTGTNSYSGGTTVEAGTLGGNSSSLQGNINLFADTTLAFSQTANGTYAGVISGDGELANIGAGFTLTLTGHNTYTGTTGIAAGTLAIGAGGSISDSSSVQMASGAGFDISKGGNQTITDLIGAAGSFLNLGGNQLTFGTATAQTVYAGNISGAGGSLDKKGTGLVILAGNNNYTGGTLVEAGTLAGNTASLQGNIDIANNATLAFSQTTNGTYGGVISGQGVLASIGAGFTLTLTGHNTYTGATGIQAGTLAIGAGGSISDSSGVNLDAGAGFDIAAGGNQLIKDLNGAAGSIVNLGANTLTFGTATVQTTFAGDIIGSGALVKQGTGTMILAGTNSYGGGTTVLDGVLGGNSLSLQGNILNDATVAFSQTANGTYSGVISGSGVVVSLGPGFTLTLTGLNTYTGATGVQAGTLAIGAGGSISDSSGLNLAAGAGFDISGGGNQTIKDLNGAVGSTIDLGANLLTFGTSTALATFAGDASGTGGLIKQGSGTVILAGTNTYSGGTSVLAGILAGNTTSLQGNILNNATLAFQQTVNGIYAGAISGTGIVDSLGTATLTFTGQNTYTGATIIQSGTLAIGPGGSIAASSGVALPTAGATFDISTGGNQTIRDLNAAPGTIISLGGNVLTAGTANTSTVGGVITGVGGVLDKVGSGVMVLAGANTYSGGTVVEAGTLAGNTTSLQGDFLNLATLVFNQTTQGTFGGLIAGTGLLVVQGGGELILSGAQQYTGATIVQGNTTLALGARSSIASSSGLTLAASGATFDILSDQTLQDLAGASGTRINLLSNALTVGTANSTTFAGNISGNGGSLTKQGSGTLTLLGFNTYSGGTTIADGTLLGNTFSVQGDILDNSHLIFNQAFAGTYSGQLSGTGTLLVQGGGALTLTQAETYTGATQVNASTLVLGPGSSIASSSQLNLLTPGAVFDMSGAGNQTIQDLVGVIGSSIKLGVNTLTEGTANSTLFDGIIEGSGGLTKQGTGILILGAVQNYSGPTTVDAGTVAINPGGSIAASSGLNLTNPGTTFDIANGGTQTIQDFTGVAGSIVNLGNNTLVAGTANSTIFSGNIQGGGAFVKQGTGTLTVLGANTYSGGTLVAAGRLTGNTTSLQGNIANNAALEFSQNFAGTYTGILSGNGALTFLGTGSYTLTNNSAGYAGTTLVNGSALVIGPETSPAGALGGEITVQNGGVIAGHGTANGNVQNPNGNVSPGGSVGVLTVTGNYLQGAAGNLNIALDSTGASRLAVGGAANISGTLTVSPTVNQGVRGLYPVLTANAGITGIFNQFINEQPLLPMVVQYKPTAVNLAVGGFAGAPGLTPNEAAVARTLDKSFTTATGDFIDVLAATAALSDAQLPQTLASFGGQIYANLAEVSLQDRRLFLGAMTDRIGAFSIGGSGGGMMLGGLGSAFAGGWGGSGNAGQFAALGNAIADAQGAAPSGGGGSGSAVPPGNFWARGYGQFGNLSGSGGTLGSQYSTGGGAVGMDVYATPDSLVGIAAAGGRSSVSLSTNPENAAISFVSVGVYGAQRLDYGLVLEGAAAYAHDFYDVTRGIVLPGLSPSRVATSNHNGNDAALDIALSRPWLINEWWITPRAGLSYFHIGQSPFSESGADSLNLNVAPTALDSLRSRVGIAVTRPLLLGDTRLVPEFKLAWTHELADDHGTFNASFAGASTLQFQQIGAVNGRDAAEVGAGVSFGIGQSALPGQITGFVRYDGIASAHNVAHTATAGLRWQW